MKKIAIPVEGNNLHGHFGGTSLFHFYTLDNGKIITKEEAVPPPHAPGAIPKWIGSNKVTDLIVGGIGQKAVDILTHYGINILKGVQTDRVDIILEKFLAGNLETSEENCNHDHHEHHHGHSH